MNGAERDAALERYAAGKVSLATLQARGIGSFLDVLTRLGELGLRPPIAPLEGHFGEMRTRGKRLIAERIRGR